MSYSDKPIDVKQANITEDELCTVDEAALLKAGIPLALAESEVRIAKRKELQNHELADLYKQQLIVALSENIIPEYTIFTGFEFFDYIKKDVIENWPDVDYPKIPGQKKSMHDIHPKTESMRNKMEVAHIKLLEQIADGEISPQYLANKIRKNDNSISSHGVSELLKDAYPETPYKANVVIKKALDEFY